MFQEMLQVGSGGGKEVYSTEELKVGTWFGKDLYRRGFIVTTPATSGQSVSIGFLDELGIKAIVGSKGTIYSKKPNPDGRSGTWTLNAIINTSRYANFNCWVSNGRTYGQITINDNSGDFLNAKCELIIDYVKE